ncbi:hypothetical protein P8452_71580 [Trifolium repens]|nr:hypothetical protein P8452_71580 [Trifolium repens]
MGSTYLFEGFMVSMCAVLFFSVLFFFLFVPTGTVYVVFQFGITIAFFYPRGIVHCVSIVHHHSSQLNDSFFS